MRFGFSKFKQKLCAVIQKDFENCILTLWKLWLQINHIILRTQFAWKCKLQITGKKNGLKFKVAF